MTKRLLIDATHPEETRVAVTDDTYLLEFDYENKVRRQLKGNIFLAKVTRVEPSLQAAFVDYGGNRHGFLPFSEIHPDYFRIPVEDRMALQAELADEAEKQRAREEAEDDDGPEDLESAHEDPEDDADGEDDDDDADDDSDDVDAVASDEDLIDEEMDDNIGNRLQEKEDDVDGNAVTEGGRKRGRTEQSSSQSRAASSRGSRSRRGRRNSRGRGRGREVRADRIEVLGGEEDSVIARPNLRRKYKIQEVIKRGQIMLIQISKEERGNKGAAVTTYISLAGRYCVLMPNSPRAGGVSRKIPSFKERKRMRGILDALETPDGMSVIVRTAGTDRTKMEIKRDYEYLARLWANIRERTLKSSAPEKIHEEADLIKRAIRDLYTRDIEDVLVAGKEGYKEAKDFMKMMIPSHAKRIKLYEDERIPLFHRYQIEGQIVAIGEPVAPMKSGGYLVIHPTEALVSIDVNSGRATKERHIEETALRTNLEAADEVARQLRLRDLGGLVVIDFIDMEDHRNNRKVQNRMRDALSNDRARVQVGRISNFGLMELSRQRLNPSLTESQFRQCTHCGGTGNIRTMESTTLNLLRELEEEGIRGRTSYIVIRITSEVALYLLNNKRTHLADIEERYGFEICVEVDEDLIAGQYKIEPRQASPEDSSGLPSGDSARSDRPSGREDSEDSRSGRSRRSGRRGGGKGGQRNRTSSPDGGAGPETSAEENNDTRAGGSQQKLREGGRNSNRDSGQDSNQDSNRGSGRKSGKGRRRRQDSVAQKQDESFSARKSPEEDGDKNKKEGSARRSGKQSGQNDSSSGDSPAERGEEKKKAPPAGRGRKKKTEDIAENRPDALTSKEAPDKRKKTTEKSSDSSSDKSTKKTAAEKNTAVKSHPDESVTIIPDKPAKKRPGAKKGWWSRKSGS